MFVMLYKADQTTIWPNKGNHTKRKTQDGDEDEDENPLRIHGDIKPQTQKMCHCS